MNSRVASDGLLMVGSRYEVIGRSRERVRFETPRFDLLRFSPENSDRFVGVHTATQISSFKPFSRDLFRNYSPLSAQKVFSRGTR